MAISLPGKSLKPIHEAPGEGDIKRSYADISKARTIGYEPGHLLEEGLRETVRRFKKATHNP